MSSSVRDCVFKSVSFCRFEPSPKVKVSPSVGFVSIVNVAVAREKLEDPEAKSKPVNSPFESEVV